MNLAWMDCTSLTVDNYLVNVIAAESVVAKKDVCMSHSQMLGKIEYTLPAKF